MKWPRSYLFVPGDRAERFDKALASGADAIVLDLEDAVADAAKPAARDAIADWAGPLPPASADRVVVRINDAASPHFEADLRLLRDLPLRWVMLPKTEGGEQLGAVRAALPGARLLGLIETARGVAGLDAPATTHGLERLIFGTLDYALDLELDITVDNEPLAYAAARLAIASRAAGLAPPVAGVTPQIDDEARLLADLAWARRRGLHAKLCVHPRQVAPVHAALAPAADELAWAQRVLAAVESGTTGVLRLDGKMIDKPVIERARRVVQRAN